MYLKEWRSLGVVCLGDAVTFISTSKMPCLTGSSVAAFKQSKLLVGLCLLAGLLKILVMVDFVDIATVSTWVSNLFGEAILVKSKFLAALPLSRTDGNFI